MRRWMARILILAMVMVMALPSVTMGAVYGPAVNLTFDKDVYKPGEVAVLTVGISDVPLGVLQSASVVLRYDTNVFQAPNLADPDLLTGSVLPGATVIPNSGPGYVEINLSDPNGGFGG